MADYFISDIHLRLDVPERGARLAQFVDGLQTTDRLFVVGDLCDYWFASRQAGRKLPDCAGLTALKRFQGRGGDLTVLIGNHDAWIAGYFRDRLGLKVVPEPFPVQSYGHRVRLAHGHRVRGKRWWKALLEGRLVYAGFRYAPEFVARRLEGLLDNVNSGTKSDADRRLTAHFRRYADTLTAEFDLVVFGHVHTRTDDASRAPRLVVLGDWYTGGSYLRIDEQGPELCLYQGQAPAIAP